MTRVSGLAPTRFAPTPRPRSGRPGRSPHVGDEGVERVRPAARQQAELAGEHHEAGDDERRA